MPIRELRRRAGGLRDKLIYGPANRRLMAAADAARIGWITAAEAALPPLPEPKAGTVVVEAHTLCGDGQADMGIWAGWSLMRYLPQGRLVVHSDGTLSHASMKRFLRAVPGTRILSPREDAVGFEKRLAQFPLCLEWTRSYHFGAMLGGFHSLLETSQIIDIDTDVLVLASPDAVQECLNSPEWSMAWIQENRSYYAYPEVLLKELLGDRIGLLPTGLNGGFTVSGRLTDTGWALFEDVLSALKADTRTDPLRYWMHQTLLAIRASTLGKKARALPHEYAIYTGPTRPGSVVRHFVGNPNTRPRFFTEGIPALIRDARQQGHIAADFFVGDVPVSQLG